MRRATGLMAFAVLVGACGGSADTTATTVAATAPPSTSAASESAETTVAAGLPDGVETALSRYIASFGASGDCYRISYAASGGDFDLSIPPTPVDCREPHDQQVYFTGEIEAGAEDAFPGTETLEASLWTECDAQFIESYGVDWEAAPALVQWLLSPGEDEWNAGVRAFACSVAPTEGASQGWQLVGNASSAGLTLDGHLLATVATFDMHDIWIYIFGENGQVLDVVNLTADDTEVREATSPPSWSPDLSQIAYAAETDDGNTEIFVVDVATGEKTNITNDPANDFGPAFSPDGASIAFSSARTGGETNLFLMDPDGGNVEQLTFHDDRDSSPDWSPDGSQIVFRRRTAGNSDIWVVNADGSDPRFMVGGPAGEYDPDWSPDGTTIAFISDETGSFDIWTFGMNQQPVGGAPESLDDAGAIRITAHPGNEEYPDWTPDSQFVLFNSDRHGSQGVWMMRANGSDQTALLFTYPVGFPQVVLPAP